MNNDWIEQETQYLSSERRKRDVANDTSTMIRYLIILFPLLFYACTCNAECDYFEENFTEYASYGDGYWWTCRNCRTSQWSNQRDWTGHFYCGNCGLRAD